MDQSWYLKETTPNRPTDGAIGNLEVLGCENFGLSLLLNEDSRMKQANWQSLRAHIWMQPSELDVFPI